MAINWMELVKAWASRLDKSSDAEKFRAYAMTLLDAPYVWGQENPTGSDCSGTVCFPLWMLGYNIRVTADVLYKELFIEPSTWDRTKVLAVFYITNVEKNHGGLKVPAGTATHVTPLVGDGVILNAFDRIRLDTAKSMQDYFTTQNARFETREIDWQKAKQMSYSMKYAWGVDPILQLIRNQ